MIFPFKFALASVNGSFHSKSKSNIARLSLLFLVLAHQTETGPLKYVDQRDDLHLTGSEQGDQALRSNITA